MQDIRMFFSRFDHIAQPGIPAKTDSERGIAETVARHDFSERGLTGFVRIQRSGLNKVESAAKRILDLFVTAIAIAILWPVLLLAAIAIKLDSEGPVIFQQRRNGLNGKEFVVYKFRTMTVLEDGPDIIQAGRGDRRVTRVGKFLRRSSIDELPQLLNVLKGDMSVVGPRPHAVAHNMKYRALVPGYDDRFSVKPGVTGWAQVNGLRGETATVHEMAKRVRADLWYINNWSFGLDLAILFRTCFEILREEAY
jgi:undecaprenyl-phosphate galactose phosphotransferase/putative colanic acid biosynthesis UDP-glucose lipid carrier transferase